MMFPLLSLLFGFCLSSHTDPISKYWPLVATNSSEGKVVLLYACFPDPTNPSEWWLCLAQLDNTDGDEDDPSFQVRAVLRATLQGSEILKTASLALTSDNKAIFVTESNEESHLYLHFCLDEDCTGTHSKKILHPSKSVLYYPRVKLDTQQRPMIAYLRVEDKNATIAMIRCADKMCEEYEHVDLREEYFPEWSPNRLISFQFALVDDHPAFLLGYNSTVWGYRCENFICDIIRTTQVVSPGIISDLRLDRDTLVAAVGLNSIEVSSLDSNVTTTIPMPVFNGIALTTRHLSTGFKIASSRWEPQNSSGVVQFIHCLDPTCTTHHQIDLDSFSVESGWFPSITLAEGKPGNGLAFYFKYNDLGLYCQTCQDPSNTSCLAQQIHDGRNIVMNPDQDLPNPFWKDYWPWFVFGSSFVLLVGFVLVIRYHVTYVRRVEYVDIQDAQPPELPVEADWEIVQND